MLTHHLGIVISEFNDFNGALFNIRARSLNNLVYWFAQILGSVSIGFLLDQRSLSRRVRAFTGWTILVIMVFTVHTWAYFYQRYVCDFLVQFTVNTDPETEVTRAPQFPPRSTSMTQSIRVE